MPLNGAGQISRQRGKHAYHGQQGSNFWAHLSLKALEFPNIIFVILIGMMLYFNLLMKRCGLSTRVSLHEPKNVMLCTCQKKVTWNCKCNSK